MNVYKLYVLTTPYLRNMGRFKIGITKMTERDLLNTYLRALPDAFLLLFAQHSKAPVIEMTLKKRLRDCAVMNTNGRQSEWVDLDEEKLLMEVGSEMIKHKNRRRRVIRHNSSSYSS